MNYSLFATAMGTVVFSSLLIKYACDSFEAASYHLGRKVFQMPPGVRGATIEAIGSSMPELLTTFFLLFLYHDQGGFAAGIATCAGSAIFNAVVIPAVCVLAVTIKSRAVPKPLPFVELERASIIRDGMFFISAELALIYCLAKPALTWWMGGGLIMIYIAYFAYLMRQIRTSPETEDPTESLDEPREQRSALAKILTLDWNGIVFNDRELTARSAWVVLVLATLTISAGCYLLAEAVMRSAQALNVPAYFTAVILGAAATSVPDTFISLGNALKGDYDDAISNAVGSNIFDICIALGLPLMAYGLVYGNIDLGADAGGAAADVQPLRIALLAVTVVILIIFLVGTNKGGVTRIGARKAYMLLSIYLLWTTFIIGQAQSWPWLTHLLGG